MPDPLLFSYYEAKESFFSNNVIIDLAMFVMLAVMLKDLLKTMPFRTELGML
jgi:hypothetical protein